MQWHLIGVFTVAVTVVTQQSLGHVAAAVGLPARWGHAQSEAHSLHVSSPATPLPRLLLVADHKQQGAAHSVLALGDLCIPKQHWLL